MRIINIKDRKKYFKIQIERSRVKYEYCKVRIKDVILFKKIIKPSIGIDGPILCLGTRNGREIDLFRNIWFGNRIRNYFIKIIEWKHLGYTSLIPLLEKSFRSNLNKLNKSSVVGVEINPDASRQDTLIGSFDELPKNWQNKFSILYSNSFDQSQDPYKTAKEWLRVIKRGGVLILGFTYTDPTEEDPVGCLTKDDIMNLFGGELIYFDKNQSHYSNIILKM